MVFLGEKFLSANLMGKNKKYSESTLCVKIIEKKNNVAKNISAVLRIEKKKNVDSEKNHSPLQVKWMFP